GIAEVDARERVRKVVLCLRPVVQKGFRRRNDARLRNYVTGKWCRRCWVRRRINDRDGRQGRPGCAAPIQQGAEVTVSESVGRYQGGGDGAGFAPAPSFVVEKEKRAVAPIVEPRDPNRSAEDRAELILTERGLIHARRAGRREVILEEAFGIKP